MKEQNQTVAVQSGSPNAMQLLGARYNIEPGRLTEVLRGTVMKPSSSGKVATNEELAAFAIVANQYDLNPFTREIYAFASGEKGVVAIVPIDGWTKIVNRHKNAAGELDFDGCEFSEEWDGDTLTACKCTMHIKGRAHPVAVTERLSECTRNTGPWKQFPSRMLRHKAFMQAARYAFGLGGIHDEDEARDIVNVTKDGSSTLRTPIAEPKSLQKELKKETAPAPEASMPPAEPTPPAQQTGGLSLVTFREVIKQDGPIVEMPNGSRNPEWTLYTGKGDDGEQYSTYKQSVANAMRRSKDDKVKMSVGWKPGNGKNRDVTMIVDVDPASDDEGFAKSEAANAGN